MSNKYNVIIAFFSIVLIVNLVNVYNVGNLTNTINKQNQTINETAQTYDTLNAVRALGGNLAELAVQLVPVDRELSIEDWGDNYSMLPIPPEFHDGFNGKGCSKHYTTILQTAANNREEILVAYGCVARELVEAKRLREPASESLLKAVAGNSCIQGHLSLYLKEDKPITNDRVARAADLCTDGAKRPVPGERTLDFQRKILNGTNSDPQQGGVKQ